MAADKLKTWCHENGFRIHEVGADVENLATWIAQKEISVQDPCESNGKTWIEISPNIFSALGNHHESHEVQIIGQASGMWYQLAAYSLDTEEIIARYSEIERSLIKAWDSLERNNVGN